MNSFSSFPARPKSLRDVSRETLDGRDYASSVKEFVDEVVSASSAPKHPEGFYAIPSTFFEDEPYSVPAAVTRAHMGGMAENLANLSGVPAPDWCLQEPYFLDFPSYSGGKRARASLEATTPSAFRKRLLFCGPSLEKLFRLKPRPSSSSIR